MAAGERVLGHAHNFDHMTYVQRGVIEVKCADWVRVIRADDDENFVLIRKGVEHELTALVDGSRYQCIYAHRMPQALMIERPGGRIDPPLSKRDDLGTLWVRVDETVVQEAPGWPAAYK